MWGWIWTWLPKVSDLVTFQNLQLGGVIHMGSGGPKDVWSLKCVFHGISFSLPPSSLPCPSNSSLSRVAPLTFLGNVNIAVEFLYYLLPFDLILANHGSSYSKFWSGWMEERASATGAWWLLGGSSQAFQAAWGIYDSVYLSPTTWEAEMAESEQEAVMYKSFQNSFLMRYLYLFPDQ